LNAGLHDLRRVDGAHGDPKVGIEEYQTNLGRILSRLADDDRCARVVLATSTPIDDVRHEARGEPNRFHRDVSVYNAALIELAGRCGAVVHDLCAVISIDPSRYLDDDGVHLTQSGNTIAGRAVTSAVLAEFAGGGAAGRR
jgi:lysophospholipase L1-like esterase